MQAVAFYDQDGRIRHMHHAIALEGGRVPDAEALEREAREHAQHLGLNLAGLRTLHVPRLDNPGGRFRVDVKSQKLVPLELPPEIRVFKPVKLAV
jgi:hypothetical protein